MSRAYLAFTEKGMALARRLARALPGSVSRCGAGGVRLAEWTSTQFAQADALIFVGAVGIAVRAIAPHCKSKATDPAVVVLDECGRFAVPLLSGHLGGANALARALAMHPSILIMDDTTSALDSETEHYIQQQLLHLPFSCTKIIIGQRISAVKDADQILVLENGRITERGTHEELLKNHGYYWQTYALQNDLPMEGAAS